MRVRIDSRTRGAVRLTGAGAASVVRAMPASTPSDAARSPHAADAPPAARGLSLRGLACLRGGRLVFAELDADLPPGGAIALVGPNGSGKSSLLRVVAGLLEPLAGTVAWDGAPVADDPESHRARLQFVGHLDAVKPTLTVRENLAFWARLMGSADPVDNALAALGLGRIAEVPGAELSAGQRRRVALARLVAERRPLWLLDEPSTGLDADSRARLERLIESHRATGGAVVAATHGGLAMADAVALDLADFQPEPA